MYFTKTENHFSTEEQAYAEIESRGWHAKLITASAEPSLHWHDFDTLVFVLEGVAQAEYEDGTILQAQVGDRVEAHAGVVHRNVGPSYRALLGLSVDPEQMTQPISKSVESKPA